MNVKEMPANALRRAALVASLGGAGLVSAAGAIAQDERDERDGETAYKLEAIQVEDRAARSWGPDEGYLTPRSAVGTKMDVPLIETPQSASTVTREEMDERGVDNLTEAVGYTPGVNVNPARNRSSRMVIDSFNIQIRGFSSQDSVYRDGTQVQAGMPYDTPTELYGVERVEILRGPASVLYGQGEPGGLVNLVTKRPTDAPLYELGAEYGSYNHRQLTADVSDSLSEDGRVRFRLTGLWRDSESHIDYVFTDRLYIAPALTWEISPRTEITFLSHYQSNETRYPWTAFPREGTKNESEHGTIPDNRYIGEPSFDGYDSEEYAVGYRFEHAFANGWTFRQNVRYRDITYDIQDTFRDYYGTSVESDGRTLNRANRARYDKASTWTADQRLTSNWDIAGTRHKVLTGLDYKSLDYRRKDSGFSNSTDSLDLYDPNYGGSFATPESFSESTTRAEQIGLYVQDHAYWTDRWVTSLGARNDWVAATTTDGNGWEYDQQSQLSLRGGVVYLADGGWAPYASYSESFMPEYGSNSDTGEQYDPVTAQQYEAGVRWQPEAYGLSVSAAAFNITRQNELVADPGGAPGQTQMGETRSRGVELGVKADLTANLQATGSYTHQRVEVVESGASAGEKGDLLVDTPTDLANLWLDYDFGAGLLEGFGLGAGVRYTGPAYADAQNTHKYPATTLVDAAVRYEWRGVRLQVSANNLLDEQKVYCNGDAPRSLCEYGMPRYVTGSLKYRW